MWLQKVAQREAGQLMEAGGVGRLEEACERQLQAAMHPTYVAALNTPPTVSVRDLNHCSGTPRRFGTDQDPRIRTNGLQILIRGFVSRITGPDPALS